MKMDELHMLDLSVEIQKATDPEDAERLRRHNGSVFLYENPKSFVYKDGRHTMIFYGDTSQSLAQWAREAGVTYTTLRNRIFQYDWSIKKALTEPTYRGAGRAPKEPAAVMSEINKRLEPIEKNVDELVESMTLLLQIVSGEV